MRYIPEDNMMARIQNEQDARSFSRYLSQLETRIEREQIGLLEFFTGAGKKVLYAGQLTGSDGNEIKSEDSFDMIRDGRKIRVSPKTLDNFTIVKADLPNAPGFGVLSELREEVGTMKKLLHERYNLGEKQPLVDRVIDWGRSAKNPNQDFGMEALVKRPFSEDPLCPQEGFGAFALQLKNKYSDTSHKDWRAGGYGIATAAAILSLFLSFMPGKQAHTEVGNPTNAGATFVPGDGSGDGSAEWNPNSTPFPDKGEGQPDRGKPKTKSFKDLQDEYLGKGQNSPPSRMKDVRERYLALTKDLEMTLNYPQPDLVTPKGYFPPRKNRTYDLADEATELEKPELNSPFRPLLLIYDVSGSMGNPEDIFDNPSDPSPGYLLATQLIKSYSKLGTTMRIMRYPPDVFDESSIFETNDRDSALTELLYNEGGVRDDGAAMMGTGTLYMTVSEREDYGPMDVVVITDSGPTDEAMTNFMEMERLNRGKDTIHWVNTHRNPTHIDDRTDGVLLKSDRSLYHAPDTDKALEVAEKIVRQYKP